MENEKEVFVQLVKDDDTTLTDRISRTARSGPNGWSVDIGAISLNLAGETPAKVKVYLDRTTNTPLGVVPCTQIGHMAGIDTFSADIPLTLPAEALAQAGSAATSAR